MAIRDITEAELKKAVRDYLQYGTNQGKWYADSLFTGEVIEVRGKTRRKIQGCRGGTADFFVLIRGKEMVWGKRKNLYQNLGWMPRLIFLELKSKKGKSTPEQNAFKIMVENQLAEYYIVRSIDELISILGDNPGD